MLQLVRMRVDRVVREAAARYGEAALACSSRDTIIRCTARRMSGTARNKMTPNVVDELAALAELNMKDTLRYRATDEASSAMQPVPTSVGLLAAPTPEALLAMYTRRTKGRGGASLDAALCVAQLATLLRRDGGSAASATLSTSLLRSPLLDELLGDVRALIHKLSDARISSGSILASVAYALARLHLSGVRSGTLLDEAVRQLTPVRLRELSPRSLAMAASAFSTSRTDERTMLEVCRACAVVAAAPAARVVAGISTASFSPADLALLASAFAALPMRQPVAYAFLASTATPQLRSFPVRELVSLLRSLALVRASSPVFLAAAADEIATRMQRALEVERIEYDGRIGAPALLHARDDITTSDVCSALHAFASLGVRPHALIDAALRFLFCDDGKNGHYSVIERREPLYCTLRAPRIATVDSSGPRSSRMSGDDLACVAWALQRCGVDAGVSPLTWELIIARATALAAQQSVAAGATASGANPPNPNPDPTARGAARLSATHLAAVLRAATAASAPARPLAAVALAHIAACPSVWGLRDVAQTLWAAAVQGEYGTGESWAAAWARVAELARAASMAQAGLTVAVAATPRESRYIAERSLARDLCLPSVSAPPGSPLARTRAQLYQAALGAALEARGTAASAAAALSPAALVALRPSLAGAEVRVSAAQSAMAATLLACGVNAVAEATTVGGFRVDAAVHAAVVANLKPGVERCSEAATALSSPPWTQLAELSSTAVCAGGIALEMYGPSHYISTPTGMHRRGSIMSTTPRTPLKGSLHWPLSSSSSEGEGGGDEMLALAAVVSVGGRITPPTVASRTPTLRTVAKERWLRAEGLTVVAIDWRDWTKRPSIQERAEFLAESGVPIPKRFL